jgi:hypothetical protein
MKLTVKRPETTVELCLDGSLYGEWRTAQAELERLNKEKLGDDRLNSPIKAKAEQIKKLEQAMKDQTVTFTLRGMRRADWEHLTTANPPRDGDERDEKLYGFNLSAVMERAIPESIVAVQQGEEKIDFDPDTEWADLADNMTDAQYEDFIVGVLQVNRGRVELPFSFAASREIQTSEAS